MTAPSTPEDRNLLARLQQDLLRQSLPIMLPPDFNDPVGQGQLVLSVEPRQAAEPLENVEPMENQVSDSDDTAMTPDDDDEPKVDLRPWRLGTFAIPPSEVAMRGTVRRMGRWWLPETNMLAAAMHERLNQAGPEAARLVRAGLDLALEAHGTNTVAQQRMTEWFGARPNTIRADENWWVGVVRILQLIEYYLVHPIYLYYGGSETADTVSEYPRAGLLSEDWYDDEDEVNVGASSTPNAHDLVVVLKAKTCTQTQLLAPDRGFHSIASTLVHELTHNICGAEDHTIGDDVVVSSVPQALMYAKYCPSKAWYNAYNLEFFCEDAANPDATRDKRAQALQKIEEKHQLLASEPK